MRRPSPQSFGPFTGQYRRYGNGIETDGIDVVCYDLETSHKDADHAQIYQFGCLHADKELRVHRRHEVRVRRLPYVVPSPAALGVTGVGPADNDDPRLPEEFEAVAEIASVLSFPPGVKKRLHLTFNGIEFDDRLLAQTFERNMRDPGFILRPREQGTLWRDGTDLRALRIDMLHVMRLAAAMTPDRFVFPTNEKGAPVLKLDALAPANGIAFQAHDALGDVEATLALARLVRDTMPEVWRIARRSACRTALKKDVDGAVEAGETLWMFRHFGVADLVPCLKLGDDAGGPWLLDLRSLGEPLPVAAGPTGLAGLAFCPGAIVHSLKWDKHPFLLTSAEAALVIGPEAVAAADAIRREATQGRHDDRLREMGRRFVERDPAPHKTYATHELSLREYLAPFKEDRIRMDRFVKADTWEDRARIDFQSPRLRAYAARLLAMHGDLEALESSLGADRVARIRRDASEAFARPHAPAVSPWMTLAAALEEDQADEAYRRWADRAYDPSDARFGVAPPSEPEEAQARLFGI